MLAVSEAFERHYKEWRFSVKFFSEENSALDGVLSAIRKEEVPRKG